MRRRLDIYDVKQIRSDPRGREAGFGSMQVFDLFPWFYFLFVGSLHDVHLFPFRIRLGRNLPFGG